MQNDKRLIDAKALYDTISDVASSAHHDVMAVKGVLKIIDSAPTVDRSAFAVHEKWIDTKDGGVCGGCLNGLKAYKKIRGQIAWCPFCGAKMDGGVE